MLKLFAFKSKNNPACTGKSVSVISGTFILVLLFALGVLGFSRESVATVFSAEALHQETDWTDYGPHPLTFTRYYRSYGNVKSGFGPGWSHTFSATLEMEKAKNNSELPPEARSSAIVRFADGYQSIFYKIEGFGTPWVSHLGAIDQLIYQESDNTWIFTRTSDESKWIFGADKKLTSIIYRNGWTYLIDGDITDFNFDVTNAFGKKIESRYHNATHSIKVTVGGFKSEVQHPWIQ